MFLKNKLYSLDKMKFQNFSLRNNSQWLLICVLVLIVFFILWNLYLLVQQTESDERQRMELWALAQQQFTENINLNDDVDPLIFNVLTSENNIPMIVVDADENIVSFNNIDRQRAVARDSAFLKKTLARIKRENPPIDIVFGDTINQQIYYGNSSLLNKLRLYPLALFLVIMSMGILLFVYLRASQIAQQNKLWTGMAKETAHQIGTPLSSLLGWVSLLKSKGVEEASHMEKDLNRLEVITHRFSKIGSLPSLKQTDVVAVTLEVFEYLKLRTPKGIELSFHSQIKSQNIPLNSELYSWVIENLIKNSIDSLKDKGRIEIKILGNEENIEVLVQDSGSGIPKKMHKKVFNPGVTTKKRGWGLGLSLAKRIVEEYHGGKISLLKTGKKQGACFRIELPR